MLQGLLIILATAAPVAIALDCRLVSVAVVLNRSSPQRQLLFLLATAAGILAAFPSFFISAAIKVTGLADIGFAATVLSLIHYRRRHE